MNPGLDQDRPSQSKTVAVVGGGLAGLATGCALSDAGFRVTLFERRPYLGGRASSYQHPGTGEVVDNCQHLLLGCCTNLRDFYRRIGVEDKIGWSEDFTFIEPGGRKSVIRPSPLPAPFHTAPGFLQAACLGWRDKLAIGRALLALMPRLPPDTGESFLAWLHRYRQTPAAIDRFWRGLLVSALNEDLDRIAVPYAAQVVRESFLMSAAAGRIGLPRVPLSELYSAAGDYIKARGGCVQLRSTVDSFDPAASDVRIGLAGNEASFDYLILALPFDGLFRLLPQSPAAEPLRRSLRQFTSSPITGVHLWFDREITPLPHAVLLDRTIQWMFNKSRLLERASDNNGSYLELVVSSSKSLVEKSKQEIVDLAVKELAEFFPVVRSATLVKSTVIKEIHATYSPRPGVDRYRLANSTPWPRVFLAGDWTATGWPATMEGAVRSGYLAAECLLTSTEQNRSAYLVPDLPPRGFMRLFT